MKVGPRRPYPARGVLAWLLQEWGAALPPQERPGLGAARGGGSPRGRSCCNAPFSVPQSPALGLGVGKEVSSPPHQSQLTFL